MLKIVRFDVFPFVSGEALFKGYEQLAAIERIGLVLDTWELVQTLDHEAEELVADGCLEFSVDLNHVVGDDGFQIGALSTNVPTSFSSTMTAVAWVRFSSIKSLLKSEMEILAKDEAPHSLRISSQRVPLPLLPVSE